MKILNIFVLFNYFLINNQNKMLKIQGKQNINDQQSVYIQTLRSYMNDKTYQKVVKQSKFNNKSKKRKKSTDSSQNLKSQEQNSNNIKLINTNQNTTFKILQTDFFNLIPQKIIADQNWNTNYVKNINRKERKRKHMESRFYLKQIIKKQKIQKIAKNFINKLKRNNINSKPIQYKLLHPNEEVKFLQKQGFDIHEYFFIAISILSIFEIFFLFFFYSFSIVFEQFQNCKNIFYFQIFGLVLYFGEIIINFVSVKFEEGKKLKTLGNIWRYYIKKKFKLDILNLAILFIDILSIFQITRLLRLILLFKFPQALQKVEKLVLNLFNTFYNEQYWSLFKVFILNYGIAHFLSILLLTMPQVDKQNNWLIQNNLVNVPWYQKYVWSYYWATNIILTVGFGDFTASTYKQAIVLIFVESIGCMTLAYNVNFIGSLINKIRNQNLQKNKNLKIFQKLASQNGVSQNLQLKITNYIQQTQNIKKKFNYEAQKSFIEKLPKGLKMEFLKESNSNIFKKLPFFRHLIEKTLFLFAQKIQIQVCYPQKILQQIDQKSNIIILKNGSIGFTAKKINSILNNCVIDKLKFFKNNDPLLVSLNFIKQKRMNFQVKSLQYSLIYFLQYETFISIMKKTQMDYEWLCHFKDRNQTQPDQYEIFTCNFCTIKHTKFTCPKIHFIPIHQHIINKYLHRYKHDKCYRRKIQRIKQKSMNCLVQFQSLNILKISKISYILHSKKMEKLKNYIKQEQYQQKSSQKDSQLESIRSHLAQSTLSVINQQRVRVLFSHPQGYDQIWTIQTDKINNYKYYFEKDNIYHLINNNMFNLNINQQTK